MRILIAVALLLLTKAGTAQTKKPVHLAMCWTLDKKETRIDTVRSRGLIDNYMLWDPGQVVQVGFVGNSSKKLRDLVLSYGKVWEEYANIRFVAAEGPAHIRISLGDESNHTYIGTTALRIPAEEPTMWIDTFYTKDPKQFRATVIHEFGHVLGLLHEHQHPLANIKWDKEKIYTSIPRSCWGDGREQYDSLMNYWYEFLSQANSFYTNGTPYDSKSIMHYAIPAYLTRDGSSTSWNYELSQGDKEIVRRFYPTEGSRSDSDEVFRMDASVKNIRLQEKPGQGYLIHTDTELKPKKEGEVYFTVVFYDEQGYPIEDNDEQFNVGGTVAAVEKLEMFPGRPVSGAFDMTLPYDQLQFPEGSKKTTMVARIYHYSRQADEYRLLYVSTPFTTNIPAVKTRPSAMVPAKAPLQAASRMLSVPAVQQRTLVWCWLAVGEMVFRYYRVPAVNRYDYQCGIIGLIYQPCFTNCTNRQCIIPSGSNYGTLNMLVQYPRLAANRAISYSQARELSLQTVVNNINAGRPIVCGISPANRVYNRDAEHAVLITGYDVGPNGYFVVVNDPFPYPQGQNPYIRNGGRMISDNKYIIPYQNFTVGMCWNWSVSNIRL